MTGESKRAVSVQMETNIQQGNANEQLFLKGKGNVYEKNGYTYLLFKEIHKDKTHVNTTIKIGKSEVTIIRQGDVTMRQTYIVGQKTEGTYRSHFGFWKTNAKTYICTYKNGLKNNTKGELQLQYDYFLQDEPSGTFEVKITIEEDHE